VSDLGRWLPTEPSELGFSVSLTTTRREGTVSRTIAIVTGTGSRPPPAARGSSGAPSRGEAGGDEWRALWRPM